MMSAMSEKVISALFCGLAIIHFLPALSGVFPSKLTGLYGVSLENTTLITLLQHRAVLFGLVALACLYAAYKPSVQWPVLIGAIISMASFIAMAIPRGQHSGALGKIIYVDAIGLGLSLVILILLSRT